MEGDQAILICIAKELKARAKDTDESISRSIIATVLQDFSDVRRGDGFTPFQVSDRSRELQHAVVGPGGKVEPLNR